MTVHIEKISTQTVRQPNNLSLNNYKVQFCVIVSQLLIFGNKSNAIIIEILMFNLSRKGYS